MSDISNANGKIDKPTITVVSSNTTITVSALTVLSPVIDIREAIGASLYAAYTWATAPTAGKIIKFVALFSEDGVTFESSEQSSLTELASYTLAADTSQHVRAPSIDLTKLSAKYMKIGVYTDEATNAGTLNSLKLSITKAI